MKILLYLFSVFLTFTAIGVLLFAFDPDKWIVLLGNGGVGLYFFFQARSWTPDKTYKIFGGLLKKK